MTLTYDRYLVSSWGRSGSTIITQMLEHHLQNHNTQISRYALCDKSQGWTELGGYPSRAWSIIHSHHLCQLNSIENTGVVISMRMPSTQALSNILLRSQGYIHYYKPEIVRLYQEWLPEPPAWTTRNVEHWKQVIREHNCWHKQSCVCLNLDELSVIRQNCVEWTTHACEKTRKLAVALVYEDWFPQLEQVARVLKIDFLPRGYTMAKDPKPWQEKVENVEEVQAWLDQHHEQDVELIETWRGMLLDRFPPVSVATGFAF